MDLCSCFSLYIFFSPQGANMAKQIGAATYIECSALQSENSVRDIFHVATLACVNKTNKNVKRNKSQRATKRISHMPGRPELSTVTTDLRKDKAKSCTVMWRILVFGTEAARTKFGWDGWRLHRKCPVRTVYYIAEVDASRPWFTFCWQETIWVPVCRGSGGKRWLLKRCQ